MGRGKREGVALKQEKGNRIRELLIGNQQLVNGRESPAYTSGTLRRSVHLCLSHSKEGTPALYTPTSINNKKRTSRKEGRRKKKERPENTLPFWFPRRLNQTRKTSLASFQHHSITYDQIIIAIQLLYVYESSAAEEHVILNQASGFNVG